MPFASVTQACFLTLLNAVSPPFARADNKNELTFSSSANVTTIQRTSDRTMQLVSKGSTLQLSPLSCVKEEASDDESLERFVLNNHIDQFVLIE